jgi:tetratricopeptide (TPR) repeat protein
VIVLAPFTITPDNPQTRAIADRIVDDVRAWLPADRAITRVNDIATDRLAEARRLGADWVVSGTADVTGPRAALHARIEAPDGTLIWSRDVDAQADQLAAAGAAIATRIAMVNTCALGGPRVRRDPETLGLLMVVCDTLDTTGEHYSDEAALVAQRRFAERAPNDALAQAFYGTGLALTASSMPPATAQAQRAQAQRQLDLALRLDPRIGEVWMGRAALASDRGELASVETDLARGLAVDPTNAHLNASMAEFLGSVGREEEAVFYARRSVALAPAFLGPTADAALVLTAAGRPLEALDLLDAAQVRRPNQPRLMWTRYKILMGMGEFAAARQILESGASVPGLLEPADEVEFRRLTSAAERPHSAEAESLARELVSSAATDSDTAGHAVISLSLLGRSQSALDIAIRDPMPAEFSFFDPRLRALVRNPRFPEVARWQGLWSYWVSSGRWPDICKDPTLSWRCGAGTTTG